MKELSIEQKAKAYDELLVKLQEAKVDDNVCDERYCCVIDNIVPELKESDDERMKEAIIATIHLYYGEPLEDEAKEMIAWLENQGEPKPTDKIQLGKKYKCIASPRYSTFMIGKMYKPEDKFLCSLMNFCSDCFEPIEDGEQKPVDFSDLRTWKYIVDAVWTEKEGIGQYLDSPFTEEVAKKLQKRFGNIEQKPAKWSEEDITQLHFIKSNLEYLRDNCKDYKDDADQAYLNNQIDWLKSLKDRVQPQPKQEWSEEDETITSALSQLLKDCESDNNWNCVYSNDREVFFADIEKWLKSLRPQSAWKPSDTQMAAIACAVRNMKESACYNSELVSLFDDLKKLKGE